MLIFALLQHSLALVPKWTPTYNMSESTVVMPCNYSGLYDYDAFPELARFGLVDYDWSNAKSTWLNESPMTCEEMLVEQASGSTSSDSYRSTPT